MMIQKVGNGYSLWNMLNSNITIGLTDKMQNSYGEYYLNHYTPQLCSGWVCRHYV